MWSVESWGRSRRRRTKCLKMKREGGGENGTPIVLLRGDGMWRWMRRWRWKWKYEGGVENAGWNSHCFPNLCFHPPPPSPFNQGDRGVPFFSELFPCCWFWLKQSYFFWVTSLAIGIFSINKNLGIFLKKEEKGLYTPEILYTLRM